MILSLSVSNGFTTPSLDLQEALEVSAALRGARLYPAYVPEGNRKNWKQVLLVLVEEILASL